MNEIMTALKSVGLPVNHYRAFKQSDKYIVWAEDGQAGSNWADGKMVEQVITGTVDYFTKQENDGYFDLIQNALNDSGISFYFNSVQYEDDTGFIHYEWVFEVI